MTKIGKMEVTNYTVEVTDDCPFGMEQEIVHDTDCWKEHGICATKKLTEIITLLEMSKKKVDRDELLKILKG